MASVQTLKVGFAHRGRVCSRFWQEGPIAYGVWKADGALLLVYLSH